MLKFGYGSHANLKLALKIYKQSFLFIKEYNSFGIIFFPFIMTVGMSINIVTTFICIKFHSNLPLLVTFAFGGFDSVCWILTVGLYAYTMASSEECDNFHEYWRRRDCKIQLEKVERKQLTGCPPIRVEIGIFFPMKRTTLINALDQCVNIIVSLLLLKG